MERGTENIGVTDDSHDTDAEGTEAAEGELRADCSRCQALCCVALPFTRSTDFAVDKAAGEPCRNLAVDHGCRIHAELPERGFPGCVAFDCFGAGQQVSSVVFAGRSWHDDAVTAREVFDGFAVLRQVHEMRWLVADLLRRGLPPQDAVPLEQAGRQLRQVGYGDPAQVLATDPALLRAMVGPLLRAASAHLRAGTSSRDLSGRDLLGADLAGHDLRGADLSGALLVGADLREADLRLADLLGTDLRGADLRGADLTDAVCLTRPQVAATQTDRRTRLSKELARVQS